MEEPLNPLSESASNDEIPENISEIQGVETENSLNDELFPNKSNSKKASDEDKRLGGSPPLKTIIILSIGPLISQLTGALYGIINTLWISKAVGDSGLTAISTYNNFDTIGRSFAFFLQVSASAKISALFGSGKKAEATQVFSDLLRLTIVCGIISPGVFLPLTKITARWFGATEDIVELGYNYIFPNLMSTIVPCIYLLCCGCLQAEGRSWLFSIVQVISLVSNMIAFAPFFLFVCHSGIAGVAYSTISAEIIPGIVLLILFYRHKFSTKPKFSELLHKFSPHTWTAVKIGLSQLIYQFSLAIPGILIRKLFGLASSDSQMWNDVMAGFNTYCRFWGLIMSVPNAMTIGFVPAGSYAYAAHRNHRFIRLLFHESWIAISWSLLSMIFTVGIPKYMCMVFSTSPGYLKWGEIIVRNATYASFALPVSLIVTSILQSQQKGNLATILSILTQLLPLPMFSLIFFFTDKKNVPRLMYAYPLANVFAMLVSIPFLIIAIKDIWRDKDESDKYKIPELEESVDDLNKITTQDEGFKDIPSEELSAEKVKEDSLPNEL